MRWGPVYAFVLAAICAAFVLFEWNAIFAWNAAHRIGAVHTDAPHATSRESLLNPPQDVIPTDTPAECKRFEVVRAMATCSVCAWRPGRSDC